MVVMYLMAPNVFRDNSRVAAFREVGGQTYAHHIVLTLGLFISDICKKEILGCLNIPEERRDNGLEGECLRVLKKYGVLFTHDMLRRCEKIN
jgi:hypothetical protein